MKQILFKLCMMALPLVAQAQQQLHCGADELRLATLKSNPELARAIAYREAQLNLFTQQFVADHSERGGGGPYIIPVVFHVIHQNGIENIAQAQIMDGLDILNKTFRKLRADTASIVAAFKPIHADCNIEFHLATKDPNGNCHSGINRILSKTTYSGGHEVKDLIHWDPTRYINIYIVRYAADLAGHAVWPSDADTIPAWDGIVIAHNYVGTFGTSTPTQSVTLAHECGHYLNLHHIWGGNNVPGFYYLPVGQAANCNEDDLVDDTPNTIGHSTCNLGAATCGSTLNNVQNAMDYSYCNIMFTEGQKQRMHACLNSPIAGRNNLWTPENLVATGVMPEPAPLCGARFRADRRVVCPSNDNAVQFEAEYFHGPIDSLRWTFDGAIPATSTQINPTANYTAEGLYAVQLQVWRDGLSVQSTEPEYVTVIPVTEVAFPYSTSFETEPDLNGPDLQSFSIDEENSFQITDLAAYSGTHSALLDNHYNPNISIDHLYGPTSNLGNVIEAHISFRYAFSGLNEAGGFSKLLVQANRNCEATWATRLTISGSDLDTHPTDTAAFIPQNSSDWKLATVNLPASYLVDGFRFRFVYTSDGNNRLYLDDINVDIEAGVAELNPLGHVVLFPNPASENVELRFNLSEAAMVNIGITDLMGRQVMCIPAFRAMAGPVQRTIETAQLRPGVYMVQLITQKGKVSRKLMVD